MPDDLFGSWLSEVQHPHSSVVRLYKEQPAARSAALKVVARLIADHFVGEETITKAGGYAKAAAVIRNSLPTSKKIRSGDFAELLATEYLNRETSYQVPIKKLRWKSDREVAMHGNDVIGVDGTGRMIKVLKGECKSRANLTPSVVNQATAGLDAHGGRPNPSTLAFITKRLYEDGRDAEARVFQYLQSHDALKPRNVAHLIFVLTGNDPCTALLNAAPPITQGVTRSSAAVWVAEHQTLISEAFTHDHGTRP
jgi:hypothetical protein